MTKIEQYRLESIQDSSGFFYFAGFRYWTASFLPALVGTTLPFWLRPLGFSFKWFNAIEFLFATVLFHAGFSILHFGIANMVNTRWPRSKLFTVASVCFIVGLFLGFHLNLGLNPHIGVPRYIFIVFGISVIFAGVLYVLPPFNLIQHIGGEILLFQSLGLLPVLGAYLVQVGDLTRTVYIASLPIVVATGLWIWVDKLISRNDDEMMDRGTLVILFGPKFSGRYCVLALSMLVFITLILAALSSSINKIALIGILFVGIAWNIVAVSWIHYLRPRRMMVVRKNAFILHLLICIIITMSSLVSLFFNI